MKNVFEITPGNAYTSAAIFLNMAPNVGVADSANNPQKVPPPRTRISHICRFYTGYGTAMCHPDSRTFTTTLQPLNTLGGCDLTRATKRDKKREKSGILADRNLDFGLKRAICSFIYDRNLAI